MLFGYLLHLLKYLSERDNCISTQVLTKSAVAMAVAQEVLRITPPVRVLYRRTTEDIVLGDIAVPAGTDIMMAPRKVL
jgi:cytochrome P450